MFGEGIPIREIAKRMGRSQASVSGRATMEKLSRKAQPPSSS
jgi:transposase